MPITENLKDQADAMNAMANQMIDNQYAKMMQASLMGSSSYSWGVGTSKPNYCRGCGKETERGRDASRCRECDKMVTDMLNRMLIESKTNKDEFCLTCYSHIKACSCPNKQALDNLVND